MGLSYHILEKYYYRTLRSIASRQKISYKSMRVEKIAYALEKMTLQRLRPVSLWIVSGISGSGKSTVTKKLECAGFRNLPNVITRQRRKGERADENIFIDNLKFKSWKKQGLLHNPHKRNGVWHALLKKDVEKLGEKNSFIHANKSVASAINLVKKIQKKNNVNLVYIFSPTFKDLYTRITARELLQKKNGGKHLTQQEILERFKEEIDDMKKSIKIPYTYIVNDSLERVGRILGKLTKKSVSRK